MGYYRDARNLKRRARNRKRPMTVGSSFDDTFKKNQSTLALQQNSNKFTKKAMRFCHKNNHALNWCLKISEPSARKLFVKDN